MKRKYFLKLEKQIKGEHMKEKEVVKAGDVFITPRAREAIHRAAAERTQKEVEAVYKLLYDSMDSFGKRIAVEQISGQDFIIYTPERRIGKTEAALYLAHEYNMPYLIKRNNLEFARQQARERGYNVNFIMLESTKKVTDGARIRTILKDECIKTAEARRHIREDINIIGIEEI